MRLIDADELMKDISVLENGLIDMLSTYSADEWDECRDRFIILVELENTKVLKEVIEEAPTVEERPRGEWIMHDDEILGLSCECSACHIETLGNPKFCPNCGADMWGEGE